MVWAVVAATVVGVGSVIGLLAVLARMPFKGRGSGSDEGGDYFDMDGDSSDGGGSDGGDGGGGGD